MRKSAGERAILKERKKLDKKQKRQIEQANKILIPVSKKTRSSLGIISFDPEGTFRLVENRWIKVFEADGDISNLTDIVERLSGRLRITMHLGAEGGRETCHLSLMNTGDIYEDIRVQMIQDEEILKDVILLKPMSVDAVMNQIGIYHSRDIHFSYASNVRGKKDWKKECFTEIVERETSFELSSNYGECFVALSYPDILKESFIETLAKLRSEIYICYDLNALSVEEKNDFKRVIEKRYNRRNSRLEEEDYLNVSFAFLTLCDSDDAREIVEQAVITMYANTGTMLVSNYGKQKIVAESVLSLGLIDEKTMRNTRIEIVRRMLGGKGDENTEIKV